MALQEAPALAGGEVHHNERRLVANAARAFADGLVGDDDHAVLQVHDEVVVLRLGERRFRREGYDALELVLVGVPPDELGHEASGAPRRLVRGSGRVQHPQDAALVRVQAEHPVQAGVEVRFPAAVGVLAALPLHARVRCRGLPVRVEQRHLHLGTVERVKADDDPAVGHLGDAADACRVEPGMDLERGLRRPRRACAVAAGRRARSQGRARGQARELELELGKPMHSRLLVVWSSMLEERAPTDKRRHVETVSAFR
ncbi:hypothetical protein [Sorangium cellulosum]|uniref:hypothetical protein n=1 Tax=Sorangium cellulosum TaxID=56 RepID=UPI0018F3D050|nr:hypothetical protein [Sorangium cellulosum]